MKKFVSILLSAAALLSLTACGSSSGSSSASGGTASEPVSAESSADQGGASDGGSGGASEKSWLSQPVKKTADGKIDMEQALKYETDFDALTKTLAEREVDVTKPVSLNARNNPDTMKIWEFLRSCYGKKIISAQQQMDLENVYEDKVYYNAVEDLPAMKGFDFIFANGDNPNRGFVDAALEWAAESSGLVTFTWHWNVPRDVDDPSLGRAFYMEKDGVKIVNWNPANCTVPGTKEYEYTIYDIDLIASYLQELEHAGVAVLWRPFHEASGSWFWWGLQDKSSMESYRRLWYMMYDRLENYHKLSNIIWVWNGQSKNLTVDPNTYDIAGIDIYPNSEDHSPQASGYEQLKSYTYEGKMLALTECGYIPDPQQCIDGNCVWLYYMPWNGGFIYETGNGDEGGAPVTDFYGTPNPNPKRLSNELLKQYFSNEAMISMSDLNDMPYGEHKVPNRIKVWKYYADQGNA